MNIVHFFNNSDLIVPVGACLLHQIFPQMFFRESTEMLFMTNKFPFPANICYVMIMAFSSTDV